MLLKEYTKNKSFCKIIDKIKGRNGIIRGFKIEFGNKYVVEKPTPIICNLEILSIKEHEEHNEKNELNGERDK